MENSSNIIYRTSINLTPEYFNNTPMYFWCITGSRDNIFFEFNCGHGWSDSVESAAKSANDYFNRKLKNKTENKNEE